jgi:hypothetical protein
MNLDIVSLRLKAMAAVLNGNVATPTGRQHLA